MGKIHLQTTEQQLILDELVKNEYLSSQFFFTGGTALSCVYLQHRESEDIDLFSEQKFDNKLVYSIMDSWAKKHHFTFRANFIEIVYIFTMEFITGNRLKVDFAHQNYKRLGKREIIGGVHVDSLIDIAVNKLLTITQRSEPKDFIDLYFLLQKFSLWDLMTGVNNKFRIEIEPFIISADFLKVKEFTELPKMLRPLTLTQLQDFFIEKAKELAKTVVE